MTSSSCSRNMSSQWKCPVSSWELKVLIHFEISSLVLLLFLLLDPLSIFIWFPFNVCQLAVIMDWFNKGEQWDWILITIWKDSLMKTKLFICVYYYHKSFLKFSLYHLFIYSGVGQLATLPLSHQRTYIRNLRTCTANHLNGRMWKPFESEASRF